MLTVTFNITTDASGDYDSDSDATTVTGQLRAQVPLLLYAVEYVDGDLADTTDVTLSMTDTPSGVDTTLLTLTNVTADGWYYPQALVDDNAGADTTFYTAQVVTGPLRVVVAGGGNAASGKLIAHLLEA